MAKKDEKTAKKDFKKSSSKEKPAKGGMSITDPKVRWNCRPGPRTGK